LSVTNQYIWADKSNGGDLWKKLRHAVKQRRKRYQSKDSRGRLRNKKHISERPLAVEARIELGHWEIDTVMGCGSKHCIVTLVERAMGYTLIGQLNDRTTESLNRRVIELMKSSGKAFKTITADNGTEFYQYEMIEQATGVTFYFATPHHSWERGTNENTNGLIRQYLPKNSSMSLLKQTDCDAIASVNVRELKSNELDAWKTTTIYRNLQAGWVKDQERKGVEHVDIVLKKMSSIMDKKIL